MFLNASQNVFCDGEKLNLMTKLVMFTNTGLQQNPSTRAGTGLLFTSSGRARALASGFGSGSGFPNLS